MAKPPESSSQLTNWPPGIKYQVEKGYERAGMKSFKFSEEIRKNQPFSV